jgi:hypothetical protein
MPTVWILPAGSDSADSAVEGDYLLRPRDADTYEIGKQADPCTWIGTVAASLLPALPLVESAQEGPDQEQLLTAVVGVESAEHLRGG